MNRRRERQAHPKRPAIEVMSGLERQQFRELFANTTLVLAVHMVRLATDPRPNDLLRTDERREAFRRALADLHGQLKAHEGEPPEWYYEVN